MTAALPLRRRRYCWRRLESAIMANSSQLLPSLLWAFGLLSVTMISSRVNAQVSDYYSNNQNRFVPSSSQFQSSRQHRTAPGQPGSYQEQILFVGNEAKPQNQQLTSPAYTPINQQTTNNRNNDYYDISPRPFGVPGTGSGPSFSRPKSFKPSSSLSQSSGFLPPRTNVPHQQSQFLQHFNEQTTADKTHQFSGRLSSSPFSSSPARPFGNGGFQPSSNRNRPSPSSFSPDAPVASVVPQQLPFRSSRNRFQPNSATTSGATTSTSTTEPASSTKRYNRYGSSRTGFKASPPPNNVHVNNPELSRAQKKLANRRPAFISREVNEPIQNLRAQKNFPAPKTGRVKIPLKNQLLKQQISPSSTPFRPAFPQSTNALKVDENAAEESVEEVDQKNSLSIEDLKEPILEKLQLNEEQHAPLVPMIFEETSTLQTTNTSLIQDSPATDQSAETQTVDTSQEHEDNDYDKNYSDEYAQSQEYIEETTEESTTLASEIDDVQTTLRTLEPDDDESYELEEGEIRATVTPITNENLSNSSNDNDNDSVATSTTTEATTTTAQDLGKINATTVIAMNTTEQAEVELQDSNLEDEYDEDEYDEGEEDDDVDIIDTPGQSLETHLNKSKISGTSESSESIEMQEVSTAQPHVNGSTDDFPVATLSSEEETIYNETKSSPASDGAYIDTEETTTMNPETPSDNITTNATEGYVVVASIQTSRSINGARFLPFPAIQQEESKKPLSELERNAKAKTNRKEQDAVADQTAESEETELSSSSNTANSSENATSAQVPSSTESIIDKLDRVQSELSSGLLAGKYPLIGQMDVSTQSTTSTAGSKYAPNIRKFQPRTTTSPKVRVHHFDEPQSKVKIHHLDDTEMDELAGLLPVGFKPKYSYKSGKTTTTTTTSTTTTTTQRPIEFKKPFRNATTSRSFKNSGPTTQDVSLAGLLPKNYKLPSSTEKTKTDLDEILSKIKFDENVEKLLPKSYKLNTTTPKPAVTLVDDISKFLPPGYKLRTTTISPTPPTTAVTKNSKLNNTNLTNSEEADDISKFLPPGYKLRTTKKPAAKLEQDNIDISQLLPKGYTTPDATDQEPIDIFKKIEFKEVASLLPPGFKANNTDILNSKHPASTSTPSTTTASATTISEKSAETKDDQSNSGFKVVFPKGIHKRIGAHRITTPKSSDPVDEGPTQPSVVIKKGLPTRATTEFTGWPTPSTTPISIEKLLEQAKTATVDIGDLLPTSSTTSTTTSTTTTTTTTTPRPTKPGFCTADCDLAATIKIVDGVSWKPELLDHNTVEWKTLAREVEAQLNEVYSTATELKQWYKKVRIDSFSQGSVLVDYYVELSNITKDVNTLEIKKLFHEALVPQIVEPPSIETTSDPVADEFDASDSQQPDSSIEEKLVSKTFRMGKYVIDPIATDFSVIPKALTPNVEFAEEDLLIPQWAIVVIVIGVGSLVFVVIFGVTVLLNRQKRAKKTPIPLTNDMLNELKINHMGGVDNYGVDDFYNIDDAWNDTKQPIKPKRFTNSMHDSSGTNIYDSWRSTRNGDYFYDGQNNYSQKGDSLQRSLKHHPHSQYSTHGVHHQSLYGHQYPDAFADAHQMYTYNNQTTGGGRSRYPRDYDPDF